VYVYPETLSAARTALERCASDRVDPRTVHRLFDADGDGVDDELAYLPWDPHPTLYDTKQWVAEQERRWRVCEGATYVLRAGESMDAETGSVLGLTTLETDWDRRTGEQMIFLRRPFYGQGMFAESAFELLSLAFTELGIEVVIADAVEGNERARDVFEQGVETFGGQYDGVLRNRLPTDDGVKKVHRSTVSVDQYRETMGLPVGDEGEAEREEAEATPTAD
jgi:RimJ/RimL family protein N-acetyltransferase